MIDHAQTALPNINMPFGATFRKFPLFKKSDITYWLIPWTSFEQFDYEQRDILSEESLSYFRRDRVRFSTRFRLRPELSPPSRFAFAATCLRYR